AGETPGSIAQDLAATINSPAAMNANQVGAIVHGDRLELRYLAASSPARPAPPGNLHIAKGSTGAKTDPSAAPSTTLATSSIGTAATLTTFLTASRNHFL